MPLNSEYRRPHSLARMNRLHMRASCVQPAQIIYDVLWLCPLDVCTWRSSAVGRQKIAKKCIACFATLLLLADACDAKSAFVDDHRGLSPSVPGLGLAAHSTMARLFVVFAVAAGHVAVRAPGPANCNTRFCCANQGRAPAPPLGLAHHNDCSLGCISPCATKQRPRVGTLNKARSGWIGHPSDSRRSGQNVYTPPLPSVRKHEEKGKRWAAVGSGAWTF